jgi:hypothetical protein
VLCVAGVDTTKARVGYSAIGPGRLTRAKPDISGYTHFRGSGALGAVDGGTSAATPVVAGAVAAVRSKRPYDPTNPATHPAAIRNLIASTAEDLGTAGYDFEHGFGVVNACALRRQFTPPYLIDFCERFPKFCIRGLPIRDIVRRSRAREALDEFGFAEGTPGVSAEVAPSLETLPTPEELAYVSGYLDGVQRPGSKPGPESGGSGGCNCGSK